MKKIYAFDFDGTIVTNAYPDIGTPIQSTINLLKKCKANADYIILYTMREGKHLEVPIVFCVRLGIEFGAINDNLPHMKEFYHNNPRKIFANYYVDDHNLFVEDINHDIIHTKSLNTL